jgi:hypothetical protein
MRRVILDVKVPLGLGGKPHIGDTGANLQSVC